jgi:predicted ATPase/DNA-binding CsgD family transcriptional regulator
MASPTMRTSPTNLPADITSFIGRRQEVAETRRLLTSSRLVTLTGAGGVGKTRLSLRVASDLTRTYVDGVWLVELANVREADGVTHAVAEVIGLRNQPGVPLADTVAGHLADRHVLIVLDNCEHVIESCSALVHDLLRRCPALHVLATSREPLGITGEFILPVPALSFPQLDREPHPDSLICFDSVNLFVERAAAGSPGFTLTPENCAAIVRICAEMEGIPLAIELAAVRVRALPLDSILQRLKDHSSPVGRDTARVPNHHRTLRASVVWSYELCSAQERTIWARLSVFSGGFDLDAARAICADPGTSIGQVTDAVASLVDKSILVREGTAERTRYRMLEILREYGQERLTESAEHAELRRRHRDWFLALAENSHSCWLSREQPAVLNRLRDDYQNLRGAFTGSLAAPDATEAALMIASALEHYWLVRGWQTEGRQWLDDALRSGTEQTTQRARALRVNAYLAALQGEPGAAAMLDEARSIAEKLGDRLELSYVTMVSGVVELCTGRIDAARPLLDEALEEFQQAGDAIGEAYTLVIQVALAAAMEDVALAELCHARCMALTEPRGEMHLRGFSLWGRGLAALRTGDLPDAIEHERASLQLKHSLDDHLGTVLCMEALAWIEVAEGRDERAATLLGATEQMWSPMRMTIGSILDFGRFREEYEGLLADRLGPRRFDAAVRRGTRMSIGQALHFALGNDDGPPKERSPLTPREHEIAQLVAKGLTNKRIALDLVLSQRTVEGHVEKIMTKLGFANRAQVAAWAAERRSA